MKKIIVSITGMVLLAMVACTKDIGQSPDLVEKQINGCDTITFTKHIKPIITNYCATSGCHQAGAQSPDLSNNAIIQSQALAGRIKARLIDQSDMPPVGSPVPSTDEINMIKCWLEAGSPLN